MYTMDRYDLHCTVMYRVLCHHHMCLDTTHYAVFTSYFFYIVNTVVTLYLPVDLHCKLSIVHKHQIIHIYHP